MLLCHLTCVQLMYYHVLISDLDRWLLGLNEGREVLNSLPYKNGYYLLYHDVNITLIQLTFHINPVINNLYNSLIVKNKKNKNRTNRQNFCEMTYFQMPKLSKKCH